MRTTLRLAGVGVTLALLTAMPGRGFSQDPRTGAEEASGQALPACALTQCVVGDTSVPGAPFTAEATTVWTPPAGSGKAELRATSRYYRDRAGRVRVEQGFVGQGGSPQRVIVTPDPVSGRAYELLPASRTALEIGHGIAEMMVGGGGRHHFVLPLSEDCLIAFFQHPANPGSGDSLGQQTMGGVLATGTRFDLRLPGGVSGSGRAERWVSPELELVVFLRGEDTAIGSVEYRLTDISLTEPPAGMFEVPADYAVTRPRGTRTWANPYAPETWVSPCNGGF